MRFFYALIIIMALLAGCDKYKDNPDFPFPEINSGTVEPPPCEDHNIRKTLTDCEDPSP